MLGFYLVRVVPYGPLVPARIFEAGERDQDGTPLSDVMLCGEVAGRPAPVFDAYIRHRIWLNGDGVSELADCQGCDLCSTQDGGDFVVTTAIWPGPGYVLRRGIYPKCLRHPIDEAEYRYFVDDKNWVDQFSPTDPEATPWLSTKRIRETAEARKRILERVTE